MKSKNHLEIYTICILLILCPAFYSFGQVINVLSDLNSTRTVEDPAKQQIFTNYTVASTSTTISSNDVFDIAIDNDGNKWFATRFGVTFFDNTNWIKYSIISGLIDNYFIDKSVSATAIDNSGNVWFGNYFGLTM